MFALRAGRVFDGDGLVAEPVVVIDGERIVSVGAPPPDGITTTDLGARVTLLPGLVDTHQHLCFDGRGSLEEQVNPHDDDALSERAVDNARRALAGGVTTLRDLGDRNYLTLGLRDRRDLPTIVAAGPPLTRPDGHCWYLGGGCSDPGELRRAVAERVERGVDVVKVMFTGGVLTAGAYPLWTTQFPIEELRQIVDDAHAAGLPVAAHCHGLAGIVAALDVGVDSIEHCSFLGPDGVVVGDDAVIARLAASGVAVSATLGTAPGAELSPLVVRNQEASRAIRSRLRQLGAVVVAGTDAGITPAKPHDVLHHAVTDFLEAGYSTLEALRAITATAAIVCGLGEHKGRLAAGYDADLLAVAGDPTRDAGALAAVDQVWRAGEPVLPAV